MLNRIYKEHTVFLCAISPVKLAATNNETAAENTYLIYSKNTGE
jgi:hypothetical protein